jgi:hypothetical protein
LDGIDAGLNTLGNTHAGDAFQVLTQFDPARFPADQFHGNNIGISLAMFYADEANANVPLSEAMRRMLRPSTFVDPDQMPPAPSIELPPDPMAPGEF